MKDSRLDITEFCRRLIELARGRVRSGEISERGLARRADISQPHLHNVFKGIRTLSPEAADRLMLAMDVTIPQVLWAAGGVEASAVVAVPLLRTRIGPGTAASFSVFRGYMPFPAGQIRGLTDPLAAYLAADLAMPVAFRAGDLVLLDGNPVARAAPAASSAWVVAENAGLRVRYVRRARGRVETAGDPAWAGAWHAIPLQGGNIQDIVRARIVWIGREMETAPAEPSGRPRAED